jgi:hypothetical protein
MDRMFRAIFTNEKRGFRPFFHAHFLACQQKTHFNVGDNCGRVRANACKKVCFNPAWQLYALTYSNNR